MSPVFFYIMRTAGYVFTVYLGKDALWETLENINVDINLTRATDTSFSRIIRPAALHKLFGNGLRNMTKSSRCCLPNSPDLNLIKHLRDVLGH